MRGHSRCVYHVMKSTPGNEQDMFANSAPRLMDGRKCSGCSTRISPLTGSRFTIACNASQSMSDQCSTGHNEQSMETFTPWTLSHLYFIHSLQRHQQCWRAASRVTADSHVIKRRNDVIQVILKVFCKLTIPNRTRPNRTIDTVNTPHVRVVDVTAQIIV